MVTYSPFYKNPNHWFKVVLKNPDSVENQEEEKKPTVKTWKHITFILKAK